MVSAIATSSTQIGWADSMKVSPDMASSSVVPITSPNAHAGIDLLIKAVRECAGNASILTSDSRDAGERGESPAVFAQVANSC